jgi:hypothetical protein
LREG